uniref:1-phosphatidylinositol-5-phosphate 4-kinase n=1 Tax=Parastrongyloides trichosuri TaxID=131310 RepID=A0A0N4ZF45_PARTI
MEKSSRNKLKGRHFRGKKKCLVPKLKLFRSKEPLLSVFMWGINHTISELMHVAPPGLLLPDDFKASSKIKVDNHLFNKEHMPSHFKIKQYCPNVFRSIREQFGISQREFLASLVYNEPELVIAESSGTSKFYTSYDRKFVIKTLDSDNVGELLSILPKYHEYVVSKRGKTLLPQNLGLYRITVDGDITYLLVMRNIFGSKYAIHKKYDLKGSTIQRQASEKERTKDLPTFKDNDFLEDNYKIYLPTDAKEQLMQLLRCDTEFLTKHHLMDYSLLVGIHDVDRAAEEENNKETNPQSSPGGESSGGEDMCPSPPDSPVPSTGAFTTRSEGLDLENEFFAITSSPVSDKKLIYFIGLVDILTYYGVKKRTASAAKSVKYGSEAKELSTVKPEQYARRLIEFINKSVVTPSL